MSKKPKNCFNKILILIITFLFCNNAYSQISADFNCQNREACGSLQTSFYDQSTSAYSIVDWSWDLEVNTSSQQNPGVIFSQAGSYTICLTVTDVNGNTDKECKEDYITIFPKPTANFSAENTEGCSPVLVVFDNLSFSDNSSIESYIWDVGGSAGVITTTDFDASITSEYVFGGAYNASLTITDSLGCSDTKFISNIINVHSIPQPIITYNVENGCSLPWNVTFSNTNIDPDVKYLWDFGNGDTYDGGSPPFVQYDTEGTYSVKLYMESGDCRDTLILNDFVNTQTTTNFSYSPTNICASSSVQFTDESFVSAVSVMWDFGDGATSTEPNPQHIYYNSGCYDVTLIRVSEECIDTVVFPCLKVYSNPEVVTLIKNQQSCLLPLDIILNGESNTIGTYQWEFLTGTEVQTFNENNPTVTIESYGVYYANLLFTDERGCTFVEDSIEISINPFVADLPIVGPSGCTPLTFTLQDSSFSQSNIVNYQWAIETVPPKYSNLSSPTFTIVDTGRYDVQLIVENMDGCIDTIFKEDYIRVGIKPEVDFVASPRVACLSTIKQFSDLSSDYADEWLWDFGDTGFSDIQNPQYYFGEPGIYDVKFIASHNGCSDSTILSNYITILDPVSKYTIDYNCEDPYTVDFANLSLGADSLMWTIHFSDTDSIMIQDSIFESYTFPDRGIYSIQHYSINFETGCDHIRLDTLIITEPIAKYTLDTLIGCAPTTIDIFNDSQDAYYTNYISNEGILDTSDIDNPTVTYAEGGMIIGPSLIITDIHECVDTFIVFDSLQINKIDAIPSYPEVVCLPDVVNLVDNSTDVLGNIIYWEWKINNNFYTSNSQNSSFDMDSIGVYDVFLKVEDDWGCIDSIIMPLAIDGREFFPDFSSDTLSCTFSPITFTPIGITSSIAEYFWDFGNGETSTEKNPSQYFNDEGVYTICLTETDVKGCQKTYCKENYIIIQDPIAQFIGDPTSATCPPLLTNFENQSINANSSIWNFGDNSGMSQSNNTSHVFTQPGAYDITLIVEMTPTCKDTLILEDYVKVEGPKGEFIADVQMSCLPIAVSLYGQSDGLYSYVWDYGNGILDSIPDLIMSDTTSFYYTETGKFTPKLIVIDSVGCTRSFAGDPIVVNDVDMQFSYTADSLCGTPLEIRLNNMSEGTTEDIDFQWIIDGPELLTVNSIDAAITISTPGQYNVSLISNYDDCIDTMTIEDYFEVAENPNVVFEINDDQLCENVVVSFTNNTTISYGELTTWEWNFGDGTTSSEFEPTHAYNDIEGHTVTLIGYTDKGCQGEYMASFDVLPSTSALAGDDILICIGDQVKLEGTVINLLEGGSFYWENGLNMSCTDCYFPTVSPEISTEYIFVGVHPNGCVSRDTVYVEVIPTPGPELDLIVDSIICLGATSIINVVNFDDNLEYIWNPNTDSQDCYSNCDSVIVNPTENTTYAVTVYNEYGCFKSDSVVVAVESSFVEFLPNLRGICEGSTTTISIIEGDNPMWTQDDDIDCMSCSEITVSPDISKYYSLTVESPLGCKYLDSIEVVIVPDNSAIAGDDDVICAGEPVVLSAQGIGDPSWSLDGTIDNDTVYNTTAYPLSTGYINLKVVFDECLQEDSLFVKIHTHADISATGDTICEGDVAYLGASGRADRYEWHLNQKDTLYTQDIEAEPKFSQYYKVIGKYRTCIPDTSYSYAYVHAHIDYEINETNYLLHLNDKIDIEPRYDENRDYSYNWSPSDGLDCDDCPAPKISNILERKDYELIVIDEETGCERAYEINVRFKEECTAEVFHLANVFSPNGDGNNDEFAMKTFNPDEFISMRIFDRWGALIFTTTDINTGWDGKYLNQNIISGVYVYQVQLICPYSGEEYSILGDVTVVNNQ
ncbi:MAG: PKD domain-containing protein [Saprospiraceae bacterium]